MVIENITSSLSALVGSLSIDEGLSVLTPLIIFVIGMAIYSVFVYKCYALISRRDIILHKPEDKGTVRYALKYLFLFPLISFVWFFTVAILLSTLSHILIISNIFLVSMATLATIRLTAYYHEELSREIAKLIPFALLAIFLPDLAGISADIPFEVLRQLPQVFHTLIYYFLFILFLEIILRLAAHGKPARP